MGKGNGKANGGERGKGGGSNTVEIIMGGGYGRTEPKNNPWFVCCEGCFFTGVLVHFYFSRSWSAVSGPEG